MTQAQAAPFDPLVRVAVSGAVSNQSGKSVLGAVVRLDGPAHLRTQTVSDGEFTFTAPPAVAGTYTLTVAAAGYARLTIRHIAVGAKLLSLGSIVLTPSLTELKVIGSAVARERLPFNTTPAALKVFPREAYRDQGQAALSTVLEQTPGVTASRSASENAAQPQAPYYASVRQGLPFETALLVDGNSIALPGSGTFDLAYIPSFVLQDVEVLKGYGSAESTIPNAVDGALNLRTADPGVMKKALLEVETDSRGGQFSDLSYGGTAGRLSFATMLAIDGNPGPKTGTSAAGEALQRAELVKARYELSGATSATATYLGSQGTLGLGATRGFLSGDRFASFANAADARESHRFGLYSIELHSDSGIDHVSARAYAMQLQRTGAFDTPAFPAIGSGIDAQDSIAGFSLQDDRQVAGNLYQVEIAHHGGRSSATWLIPQGARSDRTMLRAAAILHPASSVDLQFAAAALGFRERYSHNGGFSFADTTLWTPVFHAGAAFHVRPNLTARVALGSGAAGPPAAALNSDRSLIFVQSPVNAQPFAFSQTSRNLTLESSFGFDAGVEYRLHGDTTTLSADAYRVVTHGAFVDGSAAAPVVQYTWFNGPPMTHEGVELSLQQFKRAGLGFIAQAAFARTYVENVPPGFYDGPMGPYTANLAIVPGANVSGASQLFPGENGVSQMRVPYAQGYGEISYKWPRGSRLSLGALYYGANNPYARPAFAELNSNLELSIGGLSKFQLSVENLTNAYPDTLPLGFAGVPVPLANGFAAPANAGVLGPRTVRILFRQSIGPGSLYER